MRGVCVSTIGSDWIAETSSAGLVCDAGCCSTDDFSSIGIGVVVCASRNGPVLLRGAGAAAYESLSPAVLRGLRRFSALFSFTAFGSLGFGFGPGFLRMVPAAVSLGVGVDDAGVGLLKFTAVNPPVLTVEKPPAFTVGNPPGSAVSHSGE